MLVGYMRVSSADDRQTVDLQRDALVAAGVDPRNLHTDKASGARDDRPGLKDCLDYLSAGDTLIVWKLDRLGRSLPHLLAIVTDLKARGIAFRSLTEQMDTNTPHGELLFSALLQRLAAVRGRLSLCADQAAAAKWWLSMPMASVSAEGPMPKALSTRRTSPLMPGCRHQGRACPLRRARMTSNPLIVA
ncbi:DNA invertase [Sphingobium lactosutens DS20]|uniref:DNA invertase n=1 Tax=Sphingobium lactosutens DS20 TaxID=1331060 RepID=T0HIV3_9SPHN|nr:DNA invertase [Sphingobium lactosutens DS20]